MKESVWKIWIDTGGTFTDCFAVEPAGEIHRIKVLSKSALRGKIIKILNPNSFVFSASWDFPLDILKNYDFRIVGQKHPETKINSLKLRGQVIYLDRDILSNISDLPDFEISANEEAPILATRLATHTALSDSFPRLEMRLGSTIGTNSLLERKGAKTTLLVTKGFKDIIAIGNQQRPDIFSLHIDKPLPLYEKVIEVDERLTSEGKPLVIPDEAEIKNIKDELIQSKIESIAISFLHSYLNQDHEDKVRDYLNNQDYRFVTTSAEIAPVINYLNRTETAVVNAYLAPKVEQYLQRVSDKLHKGSLRIMTSAGGLVNYTFFLPKDSLFSGPAGGVVGAAEAAAKAGIKKILSFDMGGTSTDVARYDGKFEYQYETRIEDSTILSPSLNIETVASGGGSICQFDGYKFAVGPESAGSSPGPASYGEGGPLTITDVNLLLGRLNKDNFGIPINTSYASEALNNLLGSNQDLEKSVENILHGFLQIANEKMANAIRKISVNKGYDPTDYTLVSFGGAGGQHAVDLAEILNIQFILIPYDASLLSAVGMGHARIERFSVKQILQPLSDIQDSLGDLIQGCSEAAIGELMKENIAPDDIYIREILLYLRFKGQETTLEIEYDKKDIKSKFRTAYKKLYGHWIPNRIIEVESIKVIATDLKKAYPESFITSFLYTPEPNSFQKTYIDNRWQNIPVYVWEKLTPGAELKGPCLLNSQFTSIVINTEWTFTLNQYNQFHGKKELKISGRVLQIEAHKKQVESITLELFTNRFTAIAEEMGALLKRTSFSVNIRERLDYSCALLDDCGELIVNAPHIPVHLGGLGLCIRSIISRFELLPEDVIVTNHPGFGGSHLPDITLVAPVFDSKNELVGFVANRAHHAELGGKRPGSMPPDAKNLSEEGKVIFPMYLKRKNNAYWDKIHQILSASPYPTRSIEENLADLNGALASIQSGIHGLRHLCDMFGSSTVKHYMSELKNYAYQRLISSLKIKGQMKYEATEHLDDNTIIKVAVSIEGDQINIDFTGSSNVHSGNLNATPAIVRSAIIYVLRLMIREPVPLNEGIMRSVNIILPKGFLNPDLSDDPELCPAVVGGNTETSQRIVDTLLKAFNLAACSQGTMNNFLFGDNSFSYYETICGGVGAIQGYRGADAVHQHMTNTRITDAEILEFRYPVRIDHFYIRQNSGGEGKWRGGHGVVRKFTFQAPLEITLLTQHRKVTPFGMNGGKGGALGFQYIIRVNGEKEELQGIDASNVNTGDSIEILTPGGGGWGRP